MLFQYFIKILCHEVKQILHYIVNILVLLLCSFNEFWGKQHILRISPQFLRIFQNRADLEENRLPHSYLPKAVLSGCCHQRYLVTRNLCFPSCIEICKIFILIMEECGWLLMNLLIKGNPFSIDLTELTETILVRPIKKNAVIHKYIQQLLM